MHRSFLLLLLCGLLLASGASADQRKFVWTYQYQTLKAGESEIEHYATFSTPDAGKVAGTISVEHQLELEVGMTPRFDFSIYQVFGQSPGQSLKYKAFKLRGRHRTGTEGGDLLRPVIYYEYKANPDFTEQKIELKPILGGEFDKLSLALNPKIEWEKTTEAEWKWGYAAAAGYALAKLVNLGIEITGSENGHYFGPVISHGRDNLWLAFGSGFAIGSVTKGKPEMQFRLLLGFGVAEGGE